MFGGVLNISTRYIGIIFLYLAVIKAKILRDRWADQSGGSPNIESPRYDIYITSVWKGQEQLSKITKPVLVKREGSLINRYKGEIYTHHSRNPSTCAVKLEKNMKYILTGNILEENRLYVSYCHWRAVWDQPAKHMRKLFKVGMNCECAIEPCFSLPCMSAMTHCDWRISIHTPPCKYRMCMRENMEGGFCKWKKDSDFDTCDIRSSVL